MANINITVNLNMTVIGRGRKTRPVIKKIKADFTKKNHDFEKFKIKMAFVFEELKFIKFFEAEKPNTIPHFYIENIEELERNKQYFKDFVYTEDNKYYGFSKATEVKIMTKEDYDVSRYIRYPWCLWCEVSNITSNENKIFYEVSKPTDRELRNLAWNYNKLPKKKNLHFINENNGKCSCGEYKYMKRCVHGDKLLNDILDNLSV